jgi:D-alanyl-D-alanine carboxypeptidase
MKEKNNTYQLFAILILLAVLAAPYLLKQATFIPEKWKTVAQAPKEKPNPFEGLKIEAKSAYVFDVARGKMLYERNQDDKLPLASLTKIMTAIVATDMVPKLTVVAIDSNDVREEGDSGLLVGEKWRLSDIIDFTLTTSSNDGASAIATVAGSFGQNEYGASVEKAKSDFVARMNAKTEDIGLSSTNFLNESGLDIDENISGAYGTAKEVALLMAYAIRNKSDVIDATSRERFSVSSLSGFGHTATNTNKITADIPGLIASKTGFTDLAGGNLVVAFDAGMMHPIVVSVLGSSADGRFDDVEKLVTAALNSL